MQVSSVNCLGLPKIHYGTSGIVVGNIIYQEIVSQDKGYGAQFNPHTLKITILNTSDLPKSILKHILYASSRSPEYDNCQWYPIVDEERTSEGNLQISLSCIKPGTNPSESDVSLIFDRYGEIEGRIYDGNQQSPEDLDMFYIQRIADQILQGGATSHIIPNLKSSDFVDALEIIAMEKGIATGVENAMSQYFNKHIMLDGIWYPDDYKKYLHDEFNIEMDESFYTGYANDEFFEKTAQFTFKLKEGKKASEALLSFLKGPTVADCGNATMACYYKSILDILGEEKFDKVFSSSGLKFVISQRGITDSSCSISHFADFSEAAYLALNGIKGKRVLKLGQECHFGGVIWYNHKHPQGFGNGWNAIYVGDDKEGHQLFMAHGFNKPLTEFEINQKMLDSYNQERTPQDEKFIAQANKPTLYAREVNNHLRSHYTISDEEIKNDESKFSKGFLATSVKGLVAETLVKLKRSNNIDKFIAELLIAKLQKLKSINY